MDKEQARRDRRASQARDRRRKRGLKRSGDGGGAGKGQGRKMQDIPDRPTCCDRGMVSIGKSWRCPLCKTTIRKNKEKTMATEATRKLMAKRAKDRKLKGQAPLKTTFEAFCKDVYEKAIDGMFTIEISRMYKLSLAETRRWLELISLGKAAQYPGIYSEETGTVSCCSGEYLYYCEIGMYTGGYGHWWHYKNPGEES